METIFPETPATEGLFVAGFRKRSDDPSVTEFVGTVVFKRTYDLDPATGSLTPAAEPLAIVQSDLPDNLVVNSDFMAPEGDGSATPPEWPDSWDLEQGVNAQRVRDPDVGSNEDLWIFRGSGTEMGRIEQVIELGEPIGGRTFTLSFEVRSDAVGHVSGIALEADAGGTVASICQLAVPTTVTFTSKQATGSWPEGLEATAFTVVLRTSDSTATPVEYRRVQVEARSHRTQYAPSTTVRFENDLAIFKPDADIIVLDHTDLAGDSTLRVNGTTWMSRPVMAGSPREKALFGWEPRVSDTRRDEAGDFSDDPDDYPAQWPPPFGRPALDPLPNGSAGAVFQNSYFNGYRRDARTGAATGQFVPQGARLEIARGSGADVCVVQLNNETVRTVLLDFDGSGEDNEDSWVSTEVTMNLDTLVVEPGADRCYAVWRGAWPFDPDRHRRLVVETS